MFAIMGHYIRICPPQDAGPEKAAARRAGGIGPAVKRENAAGFGGRPLSYSGVNRNDPRPKANVMKRRIQAFPPAVYATARALTLAVAPALTLILALALALTLALTWGSPLQAQLYLPSETPAGVGPPNDGTDPDVFKRITDDLGGAEFTRNSSRVDSVGIMRYRFTDVRVIPVDGTSDRVALKIQIKAGQPPGATGAEIMDAPDKLGNALLSAGFDLVYGAALFRNIYQGTEPAGMRCVEADADFLEATGSSPGERLSASISNFGPNLVRVDLANPSLEAGALTAGGYYEVDHEAWTTIVNMDCPILDTRAPLNLAFGPRTVLNTRQKTGDGQSRYYVGYAENNLWYQPLDGEPAIIDAEAGGGGAFFYIDVTFSKGVVDADGNAIGVDEFTGAVSFVNRDSGISDTKLVEMTIESVTRPGGAPVQAGDSVVRLNFTNHPAAQIDNVLLNQAEGALALDDFNVMISIIPGNDLIYAQDGSGELKRGADWWVRVWYDFLAPYISAAEVAPGSAHVDIGFDRGVKFEVSFDSNDPRQAVMTGTRAPEPGDFVIRHYDRSAGTVKDYPPADVLDNVGNEVTVQASAGETALRLVMPQEILNQFDLDDTIDIRIARRQKDIENPGLGSVFVYGADNLGPPGISLNNHRKDSKFALSSGDTTYPRTAAFAQVGSLKLKARHFWVRVDFGSEENVLVAGGATKRYTAALISSIGSRLNSGEEITVALGGDGLEFPGENLTFSALNVFQSFDVQASQTARGTPTITADLGTPVIGTSVAATQTKTVSIDRNFVVTFEDETEDSDGNREVLGRENRIRVGLLGDTTALLVSTEQLVVSFDWETALDGADFANQELTLTAGSRTAELIVRLGESAMEDDTATLQMSCVGTTVDGVSCAGSGGGVSDIDVSDELFVVVGGEVPVEVRFRDAETGEALDAANPLILPKGEGNEVTVEAYLDAEALDGVTGFGGVVVGFNIMQAGSGVTMDPPSITLNSGHVAASPRSFKIRAAATAPTAAGVEAETTNSQAAALTRIARVFVESTLYINVVPNLVLKSGQDLVDALDTERGTTVVSTLGDDRYIVMPGPGEKTALDLSKAIEGSGDDLWVCLKDVDDNDNGDGSTCGTVADFMHFPSTGARTLEVGPYRREIVWAGVESGNPDPVLIPDRQPKYVYVAPMVGFDTTRQRYEDAGVDASVNVFVSVAEAANLPAVEYQISRESSTDVEVAATGSIASPSVSNRRVTPAISTETIPDGRVVTITRVGDVTAENFPGNLTDEDDLINGRLFSVGNDVITLLPYAPRAGAITITDDAGDDLDSPLFLEEGGSFPSFKVVSGADLEIYAAVHSVDDTGTATFTIETSPTVTRKASENGGEHPLTLDELGVDTDDLSEGDFVKVFVQATSPAATLSQGFQFAVVASGATAPAPGAVVAGVYARAQRSLDDDNPYLLGTGFDRITEGPSREPFPEIAGGVHDYAVSGLSKGEVISAVLTLVNWRDARGAAYKYTEERTPAGEISGDWNQFVAGDEATAPDDVVYSAPPPCPAPSASREGGNVRNPVWRFADRGVHEGDGCLLLQIADGGINDADYLANGIVHDPVALGPVSGDDDHGAGASEPFWLVFLAAGALLAGVGFRRRKARLPLLPAGRKSSGPNDS